MLRKSNKQQRQKNVHYKTETVQVTEPKAWNIKFIIVVNAICFLTFVYARKVYYTPRWTNAVLQVSDIVGMYPHDRTAFTQGLLYDEPYIIESTGQYGMSGIRRVNVTTGKVLQHEYLPEEVFGEGATKVNDSTYMVLTWNSKRYFTVDAVSLKVQEEGVFTTASSKGWGMTTGADGIYVSDGTSTIYVFDRMGLETKLHEVKVTHMGKPLTNINELEFAHGKLYANVWFSSNIYRIHPTTGVVEGVLDCSILKTKAKYPVHNIDAVLNGIAYNPHRNTFYLTGKLWDTLFEIKLHHIS